MAGILLYLLVLEKRMSTKPSLRTLALGIGFGVLAILSILNPVVIREGVHIDAKYSLVLMASMYGGAYVGSMTLGMAMLFRLFIGGLGVYAAIPTLILSWFLGNSIHRWRLRNKDFTPGVVFFIVISIALCLIHVFGGLVYFSLVPQQEGWDLLIDRSLPALALYPFSTLLLGLSLEFIVSRRQLQEQRNQLLLDLAQRNNEMQSLYFSLLHDLRNPLVNIKGFLSEALALLQEGNVQEAQEDLEEVRKASDRLFQMLQGLSELDRATRPVGDSTPSCFPDAVIRQIASEWENAQSEQIEKISIQPGVWPKIHIEPQRFQQILQILFENSLSFRKKESPVQIRIFCEESPTAVTVIFADNGIGIAPSLVKKVFDLFERGSSLNPGMGLGLTLAKRIVESHQGRIWIESEGEGHGTRVHFQLPKELD